MARSSSPARSSPEPTVVVGRVHVGDDDLAHLAARAGDEDDAQARGHGLGHRAAGPDRLVVGVGVDGHERRDVGRSAWRGCYRGRASSEPRGRTFGGRGPGTCIDAPVSSDNGRSPMVPPGTPARRARPLASGHDRKHRASPPRRLQPLRYRHEPDGPAGRGSARRRSEGPADGRVRRVRRGLRPVGRWSAWRAERLTDMLNDHDEIQLIDVLVEPLDGSAPAEIKEVLVRRDEIVLVHATGPRGDVARRRRTRQHPVSLDLDRYAVHGYLHALPGADPLNAIRRRKAMVPMTDAVIEFEFQGERSQPAGRRRRHQSRPCRPRSARPSSTRSRCRTCRRPSRRARLTKDFTGNIVR